MTYRELWEKLDDNLAAYNDDIEVDIIIGDVKCELEDILIKNTRKKYGTVTIELQGRVMA